MAYGQESQPSYLQAGVNENVFLTKFTMTSVSTPKFEGKVIDIEVGRDGATISKRIFPANPQSEYFEKQSADITSFIKAIVGNYTTKEAWLEAMSKVKDFESLYSESKALLPQGFEKIPARVVLTYAKKNTAEGEKYYLEIPNHWQNKPWTIFTTNPQEEMGVSSKILLERPTQTSTPSTPTSSDAIPF